MDSLEAVRYEVVIEQENPVYLKNLLLFYLFLFLVSVASSVVFTKKVRGVPGTKLGHIHFILAFVLWGNVIANVPFSLILGPEYMFVFDSIFDNWQLVTCMLLHLLINRILTFKVKDYKKYYLAVGLYCYLLNFVMLVTKDVLKHVLITLREADGAENVDH